MSTTEQESMKLWSSMLELTDFIKRNPVSGDTSHEALVYASTANDGRVYNFGIDNEAGTYSIEEGKEVLGVVDLNKIEPDLLLATVVSRLSLTGQHHKRIAALLAHLSLAVYAEGEKMIAGMMETNAPPAEKNLLLATGLVTGLSDVSAYIFSEYGLDVEGVLSANNGEPDPNVTEETYRLLNVAFLSFAFNRLSIFGRGLVDELNERQKDLTTDRPPEGTE